MGTGVRDENSGDCELAGGVLCGGFYFVEAMFVGVSVFWTVELLGDSGTGVAQIQVSGLQTSSWLVK